MIGLHLTFHQGDGRNRTDGVSVITVSLVEISDVPFFDPPFRAPFSAPLAFALRWLYIFGHRVDQSVPCPHNLVRVSWTELNWMGCFLKDKDAICLIGFLDRL